MSFFKKIILLISLSLILQSSYVSANEENRKKEQALKEVLEILQDFQGTYSI